MNEVVLSGRVATNPVIRVDKNGELIANFKLCVIRSFRKDVNGRYIVDYYNINNYYEMAEICRDHLLKGTIIIVKGHLEQHKDKSTGRNIPSIVSEKIEFYNTSSSIASPETQIDTEGLVLE